MNIPARSLQQAIDLYFSFAYPSGPPASALALAAPIRQLPSDSPVPLTLLLQESSDIRCNYTLRLGQPLYPYMKLAIDPIPRDSTNTNTIPDFLFRVDAHDDHLHAPPGSPDAAWLASIRASNADLAQKIESAWAHAGLPTFKEYLRQKLEQRKHARS